MGYWEQNEEGNSFAEADSGEEMLWGDSPADIVDNAISSIIATFVHDIGRLPSKAEIMAGLTFSTAALDGLPDKPSDSPEVSSEDREIIDENYYAAVHHERPGADRVPEWHINANRRVGEVLRRLREPFEKRG